MSSEQPTDSQPAVSENPSREAAGAAGASAEASSSSLEPQQSSAPSRGNVSAESIRADVEREQALADAQRKLKQLEDEVAKVKGEKETAETEREGANQTIQQLRSQFSALQSSHHKSTSEFSVLQTRIEIVEREKKELVEEANRVQERASKNNQDLYTLRAQRGESAQKIAHLDVEISELRMSSESAKFNAERSQQALQAARSENSRLGKSHADVEERFGKYRAEKQSQLSTLQTDHDILLSRLTTAESSYQALQRSYNDQANRLASAFADISNLTSSAAARKASSQTEVLRLAEENRVLERRAEDARQIIADRETELERVVEAHEADKSAWEGKWKGEERRRREAEKRAEELRAVVDRLALAGGEGTDLSPAAALAGELKGTGKSYTQFFTEYTIQEGKLRVAENEIARLTDLLDEISGDIAEKKPLLDEQAAEHAAAIDRANALAGELSTVMTIRDGFEEQVKSLNASAAKHTDEVASLQSTADDLSRQVQTLVRQLAIRDDPSLATAALDIKSVPEGDIITDHLLEFRSLRGLQENNQKLLKLTRALMAKLDQREIQRATADNDELNTGETLDQATETITRLHKQLLEANKKINEATRERDFFSKLLARGEGLKWSSSAALTGNGGALDDTPAPHQQTIEALRVEIEGIRVKAEEDARALREEVRVKGEAVGVAEVGKARAEAKVSMLEEQSRSLTDTNTLQRRQNEGLESQLRQVQASIQNAQNEARLALEQAALRQAEADRLRMDAAMLRAEKEQWSSTEARLQADFRTVQSERAKLQQLIENLTTVSTENEKSRSEEKSKLEQRVEELSRETAALRAQIDKAREATRAAEQKVTEADARIETAVTAIRAEKEAAEALAASRQTEIAKLQTEVKEAQDKEENTRRIGLNWKRQHDLVKTELSNSGNTSAAAVAEKDKEIAEIKAQLDTANKQVEENKAKTTEIEGKLVTVQRAEQLKEQTVQRLQSELTAARSRGAGAPDAAALTALQNEKSALQAEKDSLQQKLTQAQADLAAAQQAAGPGTDGPATTSSGDQELQGKLDALQKEKDELQGRYENNVTRVNSTNVAFKRRIAELGTQLAESTTRAEELQKKIETLQSSSGETPVAGVTDAAQVDEAIKAAVTAKEAELKSAHSKALEEARAAVPGAGQIPDQATIDTAVKAKEAELTTSFDSRLSESLDKLRSDLEGQKATLETQATELRDRIKQLERQVKTAEITRKTLERRTQEAEAKMARMEGKEPPVEAGATNPPASTSALSPAAPAFTPAAPAASTPTATTPTAPAAAPTRGAIRGRARGQVRGVTRGAAPGRSTVLDNVNATLLATQPAQSAAPSPPAAAAAQKRPAPEEGEISESSNGTSAAPAESAATTGTTGEDVLAKLKGEGGARGRVLKRPRGAAPGRGGAADGQRRVSAGGASTTGAVADGQGGSAQGPGQAPNQGGGNAPPAGGPQDGGV